MLVISTKNLYKSYGVKEVLSNVSFNINEGD
ncbi:ABC transporter, ATP-binding protein, partial [Candidatus Arthromitus sp. SFB-5]